MTRIKLLTEVDVLEDPNAEFGVVTRQTESPCPSASVCFVPTLHLQPTLSYLVCKDESRKARRVYSRGRNLLTSYGSRGRILRPPVP